MKPVADIPEPKFIGYFAMLTMKQPDWLKALQVEEICSASDCTGRTDWDWIDEWRHNAAWVFDSSELAWSVVPQPLRGSCDMYAFRLFPVRYELGDRFSAPIPDVKPEPMDTSFTKLGYDLVSSSAGNCFEHSPLSCNGLATEVPTNRYCLLDTAEEAFALAPTLDVPGQPMRGEPGPYFIVEVWRQRREQTASFVA